MLLSYGCADGSDEERTAPSSESRTRSSSNEDAGGERTTSSEASTGRSAYDEGLNEHELMCRAREQAISDWLADYRHCDTDSDCELSATTGCTADFDCGLALNVDIDHSAFEREASRKRAEFVEACGCPDADCEPRTVPFCDPRSKLCEVR